jgi:hypothetical protein
MNPKPRRQKISLDIGSEPTENLACLWHHLDWDVKKVISKKSRRLSQKFRCCYSTKVGSTLFIKLAVGFGFTIRQQTGRRI